jgi:hypothetical protein
MANIVDFKNLCSLILLPFGQCAAFFEGQRFLIVGKQRWLFF